MNNKQYEHIPSNTYNNIQRMARVEALMPPNPQKI